MFHPRVMSSMQNIHALRNARAQFSRNIKIGCFAWKKRQRVLKPSHHPEIIQPSLTVSAIRDLKFENLIVNCMMVYEITVPTIELCIYEALS